MGWLSEHAGGIGTLLGGGLGFMVGGPVGYITKIGVVSLSLASVISQDPRLRFRIALGYF
jgi:hypothetical protein